MGKCPATGLPIYAYHIKICKDCPYGNKDDLLECKFHHGICDKKKVSEYQDKILEVFNKKYFGNKRS